MRTYAVIYQYLDRIKNYDLITYLHSCRVANYSVFIGKSIGLTKSEIGDLYSSAYLHDIGKIDIDRSIINSSGKLNNLEWTALKKHPALGAKLVKSILDIQIVEGIISHHEKWDGTGYPSGLKREDIPLYGRVIAIADAFDAMTSTRPYRPRRKFKAAINEILACQDSQFDPYIINNMADMPLEEVFYGLKTTSSM